MSRIKISAAFEEFMHEKRYYESEQAEYQQDCQERHVWYKQECETFKPDTDDELAQYRAKEALLRDWASPSLPKE